MTKKPAGKDSPSSSKSPYRPTGLRFRPILPRPSPTPPPPLPPPPPPRGSGGPPDDDVLLVFPCEYCGRIFQSRRALNGHMRTQSHREMEWSGDPQVPDLNREPWPLQPPATGSGSREVAAPPPERGGGGEEAEKRILPDLNIPPQRDDDDE